MRPRDGFPLGVKRPETKQTLNLDTEYEIVNGCLVAPQSCLLQVNLYYAKDDWCCAVGVCQGGLLLGKLKWSGILVRLCPAELHSLRVHWLARHHNFHVARSGAVVELMLSTTVPHWDCLFMRTWGGRTANCYSR